MAGSRVRALRERLRERNPFPEGSATIGLWLIVGGVTAYLFLAVSGRALGSLTISFDQLTIDSRSYQIRGSVQEIKGRGLKGETGRIAVGSAPSLPDGKAKPRAP